MSPSRRMPAMKPVGERSAGNPHAAFDERGRETGSCVTPAPFLDSTTSGAAGRRTPEFESEINVLWGTGVTAAKNGLFFGPPGVSRGTCRKCLMRFTELRRGTRSSGTARNPG